MNTKGIIPRLWRKAKRVFLILFIAQFVYILLLKWVNPPFTITQLSSWITGHGLKRDYVSRSKISPNAKLAVIASEDQLFPDHNGFDFKSIEKAMKHNQKSKSLHGASTISQQVAKNVFLWQGRSFIRKGLEVYFTFMIELIWGKKRILQVYLNVSEMGDGIFGIEAASQAYFGVPAANLTRGEAARIAAALPNPRLYKVKVATQRFPHSPEWILHQMGNLDNDPDIREIVYEKK